MSIAIVGVVLAAAALHALWNTWVKSTGRPAHAIGLVSLGWCLAALVLLPFLPFPARASWPFLGASVVIHLAYMIGLARLYEAADLSRAYVLVRAIPPVLVTLFSTAFLGERLTLLRWIGVALVIAGVLSVSPPNRGAWHAKLLRALVPTVLTIAAYTLVDGVGARRSGAPIAYALVLSVIQGALYVVVIGDRAAFIAFARAHVAKGLLAGFASVVAYTSVLWCMTRAPIGIVAALRKSSVLVASFLGAALLRERVHRGAWVGAALVLGGAVAMR